MKTLVWYLSLCKFNLKIVLSISQLRNIEIPQKLKYYIIHRAFNCYEDSANFPGIQRDDSNDNISQRNVFLTRRGSLFRYCVLPYEQVLFEPNENPPSQCNNRCKTYFFYHIATCSYLSKVKHLGVTVNHSGDSDLCAELRAQCMVATNYDSI